MGTPGDKANITKIEIKSEEPSSPDEGEQRETPVTSNIIHQLNLPPVISTTTAPEMTVLGPLQAFPSSSYSDFALISPALLTFIKPEPSLEQAYIEDYYSQTKLYQSPKKPLAPVASLEEPGPSGLQSTNVISDKKKSQGPKKVHTCQACQKTFQNAAKLSKHLLSHSGGSFKCENCKKTFTSKFKLVRHALIHSDRRPFSCSVCDRTFHRKDHLRNHLKVHSPCKKLYVCEKVDCKKEYTSLLSFKKHMAVHAAEGGSLVCQVCHRTFGNKEEIMYHLKVHAGSRTVKNPSEKKFNCDYCERKFFTRKDVRRHLVVHTGMRDFLCQFCPQRFGRKDHLVRHIKKSHSKELEQNVPSTSGSVKVEPETFDPGPVEIPDSLLFSQDFASQSLEFLPGPSTQKVLKDLEIESLEDIKDVQVPVDIASGLGDSELEGALPPVELMEEPVFCDQDILQQLLQTTDDTNIPLPGFSQTFQVTPPQPPPKPPPRH